MNKFSNIDCMKKKHNYEFDTAYGTDDYIPYNVARLYTGNGKVIRIFFTTNGIKLFIPKSCKDNGDITFVNDLAPGLAEYVNEK